VGDCSRPGTYQLGEWHSFKAGVFPSILVHDLCRPTRTLEQSLRDYYAKSFDLSSRASVSRTEEALPLHQEYVRNLNTLEAESNLPTSDSFLLEDGMKTFRRRTRNYIIPAT
jgi:hypothetical protein